MVFSLSSEKEPEVVHAIEDGNLTHYQVLNNESAVSPEESLTS